MGKYYSSTGSSFYFAKIVSPHVLVHNKEKSQIQMFVFVLLDLMINSILANHVFKT